MKYAPADLRNSKSHEPVMESTRLSPNICESRYLYARERMCMHARTRHVNNARCCCCCCCAYCKWGGLADESWFICCGRTGWPERRSRERSTEGVCVYASQTRTHVRTRAIALRKPNHYPLYNKPNIHETKTSSHLIALVFAASERLMSHYL